MSSTPNNSITQDEVIATLAGIKQRALWGMCSDDSRINEWIARNAHAFIWRIEKGCTPPEAIEAAITWINELPAGAK